MNEWSEDILKLVPREKLEEAQRKLDENPGHQRFLLLNAMYYDGTASPEEREEFEDRLKQMDLDDPTRLMPDTRPNPWERPSPEVK